MSNNPAEWGAVPVETKDDGPAAWGAVPVDPKVERAGPLSNDGDGWLMGAAKGAATGVVKGLSAASPLTWAPDMGGFADYVLARAEAKITGKPMEDVMAGMAAKRKAQADDSVLGRVREAIDPSQVLPTSEAVAKPVLGVTGEYQPESGPGRALQGAVQAAVGGLGAGGGGVVRGATGAGAARASAALAPLNAVGGASSSAVTDVTGDPLLGAAAGMVGPGLVEAARNSTAAKLRGFTQAGREEAVGARLRAEANDPAAMEQALFPGPRQPGGDEIIPGSQPTTGELTGDRGILEAQRRAVTEDGTPFNEQRDQGAIARQEALAGLAPDADVMKPGRLFETQRAQIEQGAESALARMEQGAQELASRALGPGETPEARGAAIRSAMEAVKAEAKQANRRLYDAVDPDGSVNLVATPIRETADTIRKSVGDYAAPVSDVEKAIYDRARSMPDVVPFKSMMDFDQYVTAAMKQERLSAGETPVWGRLSQMKSGIQKAINEAVDNQVAYDQAAVGAGKKKPADTVSARLEQLHDEYNGQLGRPRDAEGAAGENRATGTAGLFGDGAAPGAGGGRSGDAAGAARVPEGIPAARLPVERRKEVEQLRKQYGDAVADKYEAQQLRELAPKAAAAPDLNDFPIYYPGGNLRAKYQVMEHGDLVTSHDANFKLRPEYPQQLQPRARESAPARDQVNGMAARIQPERLGPSPEANSGAPIVGPDGVVESGNGRALAIGQHYQKGGTEYRNWLEQQGFDTAGMKQPVLVARRVSEMSPQQREYFAHSANSSGSLRMNAAEQASADAKLISRDTVAKIGDMPVTAAENRPFVREFVDKLPAGERGGILDKDGNLSQAGERRLSAALASRAFDDAGFIGKAFDSTDSNIKQLASALTDAAGPWARMREAAHDGLIDASHDVTHELMAAVKKIMRARDEGRPIGEILRQNDMFQSDIAPLIESLLFRDVEKGLLASRKRVGDALKAYAAEAEKNLAGPRLFGDDVKATDILKTTMERVGREPDEAGMPVSDAPTFDSGPREVRRGLQPNFDEAAAGRLKAAKSNYGEYARTFKDKPVAPTLKGFNGSYDVPNSAVPSRAVLKGDKGYETAKAFLKAAKNDPNAVAAMLDHVVDPLRKKLGNGTISESNLAAWKRDYGNVLRAFDEVSPGFSKRFDSAAKASDLLTEAGAIAKQNMAEFQKSAAAKLIGKTDPVEVENAIGTMLKAKHGPTQIADLVKRADKESLEGLRKAGVDYMVRAMTAVQEAGTSGTQQMKGGVFNNFVRNNEASLSRLYPPEQVAMMKRINDDYMRASRLSATRVVGSPGTAKDMGPIVGKIAADAKKHASLMSAITAGVIAGAHSGTMTGIMTGMGIKGASYIVGTMRAAGIKRAEDAFRDALLNPERARYYLAQVQPERPNVGPLFALSKSIRRELASVPTQSDERRKDRQVRRASGGRVSDEGIDSGGAFGTYSPAEDAGRQPSFLDKLFGAVINSTATLPKRAIENSQYALDTGNYDPSVPVEAAMTAMTGGVGGTGGGVALGSGPIKRAAGDSIPDARDAILALQQKRAAAATPEVEAMGIWNGVRGKQADAERALQMNRTRYEGLRSEDEFKAIEDLVRQQYGTKWTDPAKVSALRDKMSEHALDVVESGGAVTADALKAAFPKADAASIEHVLGLHKAKRAAGGRVSPQSGTRAVLSHYGL